MARKTVRVDIPRSKPEAYLKLIGSIIKKHEADPAASKLDAAELAALKAFYTNGMDLRTRSEEARKLSQSLMEEANKVLGLSKGQSKDVEGTCLYLLTGIRDGLLKSFRNNEEKLSEYGFNVVVNTAKSPTKKTP